VAWVRVLPTALLVPAFGLGVLPVGFRLAIGFMLAASVAPLLHASTVPQEPWIALLLREFARGVPVAAAASVSLWAAAVAGGVADHVTRAPIASRGRLGLADGAPFSTLLFLAAAGSFLRLGGAERIAARLAAPELDITGPLAKAVNDLAAGVDLGVGIGAPLLVAALVWDIATVIAARELWTVRVESTFAPFRSLVLLVGTAVLLDRMATAVAAIGRGTP